MFPKNLKELLFSPLFNIIFAVVLLSVFWIAAESVTETFEVASMSALNNIRPQPFDYIWKFNFRQADLDRDNIRYYADYYEHLKLIFPSLREIDGLLGYYYHYLSNDHQAEILLKKAIEEVPANFWNYYNLGAIYINQGRYDDALIVLRRGMQRDPTLTLKMLFSSPIVYLPLMKQDAKTDILYTSQHLREVYGTIVPLIQVLERAQMNPQLKINLEKVKLELYAF